MTNNTTPPRLLIHCEGETEKQYLTTIVNALQIQSNVSIRNTAACDPMSLLEAAYKEFQWSQVADKASPFTEYWLVFDRDHHQTYDAIFEMAENMSSAPHLCWTNPCIEFWFWLHYTDDITKLHFDDRIEVFHEEKQQNLGNGLLEITTVRRLQQTVKPETMLTLLKKQCPKYNKAHCPADLVSRSHAACTRLQTVAQSENPLAMGSAMPSLLQRLTELSDMLHPKKESQSPSVKPATPVAAVPENPCEPLMTPLRQCLSDWPHITLHNGTLTAPEATFTHFETFLTAAAASKIDRKTRARGRAGLNCLKNLVKLADPGCPSTKKASKIAGRLTVLGQLLAFFAKLMGLEEEIVLLDFNKSDIAFPKPQQSASHASPELSASQAEPPIPEVDGPFTKTTPDPQTLLKEKLQTLKSLQSRFQTALACITVSDQGTPQEMLPGVCEKAASLTTEATVLLNGVTAILTDGTDDVPPSSPDVWQAMWDDYNAYLEYGRD